MIKEVEANMKNMVLKFNEIIRQLARSQTKFNDERIEGFASQLQINYDKVLDSIQSLDLPQQTQNQQNKQSLILKQHKQATQKFNSALCRAKMWKKEIHLKIQRQLNDN